MGKIISIAKIFGVIAGTVTTLWLGFKAYDNIIDGQEDMQESVDNMEVMQTFIFEDITAINDSLEDIVGHQKHQDQHMDDMESAARFYIHNQKALTEEAMEEALEIMMKRKEISMRSSFTISPLADREYEIEFEPDTLN